MSAIKVGKNYFSGLAKVYDASPVGLAAIIRGMAIDTARVYFKANAPTAWTDNSTGTAASPVADIPLPPSNTATASLGEQTSSLITSLGKAKNATLVMVTALNIVRTKMGLPIISYGEGTVASANTIPAQDLTGTGTGTLTAVADYATSSASLKAVKSNIAALVIGLNEILTALGQPKLVSNIVGATFETEFLELLGTPVSSPDGTNAILVADVTTFLAAAANAIASIAAWFNRYVAVLEPTAFTDSTTGTAAAALAAAPIPAAAAGAATTSAPKAGFDTQLATIKNCVASLAYTYNTIAVQKGLPAIIDNSGGANSATLASISHALSAVDGSTGTSALDVTTATARMTAVDNALSSLGAVINELCIVSNVVGLGPDLLGGVVSNTLAALPATATGVGGAGLVTMLNTAVDTWLADTTNNISTLAAALGLANTEITAIPFLVIAG